MLTRQCSLFHVSPHLNILQHAHKDMKLAVDMAKEAGVAYQVTEHAEMVFRQVREDAELNVAEEDFSAVFQGIHKASKSEFSNERRAA
jgi:3-hydroxyisobutyrate dehydrogenase-like beta-hydroxyacid dehydrogenase